MHISLDWLKDFIEIPKNLTPEALGNELTLKTAEVEGVIRADKGLEGVVVGELIEISKHPNANKLNLAKVDIGKKEPIRLIFGQLAKMKVGDRVPVAVAPTTLPTGAEIKKCEMRGEISEGMLCLDQELGFKEEGFSIQYFPDKKPGTPLAEALDIADTIFEFDNKSLTHRPDLWGHYGIAREISTITGAKLKPFKPKVEIPQKGETIEIKIDDYDRCSGYCGLIINNIKVQDSPEWLAKRLKATGHGVHNNIVDVTNYVMHELGKPMHAFDRNYIKGAIHVRNAKQGEKITTLDNKARILDPSVLVIADDEKPVAIAGIMGAENSEINQKTTSIILESANFNAGMIRRTSTKLGLRTDAVQMFEKSLDPYLAELSILRAAELILRICPNACIAGPITNNKGWDEKALKVDLDCEKTSSKIGVKISQKEISEILKRLGFENTPKNKKTLEVTVPHFRPIKDIEIEDDLIEEVARIYGYENIPASLPSLPTKLPLQNPERFKKHRTRELFSLGLGFDEVYNYSFYGKNELKNCLMNEDGHLKLENYLSEDQTHLRTSLAPNILKNIQENIKNYNEFKLYEIGRTYKELGQYMPLEEKIIGGAIVSKKKSDDPFYQAKGAVEAFLNKFNVKYATAKEVKNAPYAHPVKGLTFLDQDAQTLAKLFMIHPQVIKNHGLEKYSIAMFEINFTDVMKKEHPLAEYHPLPKFPSIEIDVSVVISSTTEIAELEKHINKADETLIQEVKLFDIYEGENLEKGKKAVAFKITLQAADRTLTDQEMAAIQQKIFKNLESLGGKIRGK